MITSLQRGALMNVALLIRNEAALNALGSDDNFVKGLMDVRGVSSSAKRENFNDFTFSSYHENVKCITRVICITHLYHKRITRTATLKHTLK